MRTTAPPATCISRLPAGAGRASKARVARPPRPWAAKGAPRPSGWRAPNSGRAMGEAGLPGSRAPASGRAMGVAGAPNSRLPASGRAMGVGGPPGRTCGTAPGLPPARAGAPGAGMPLRPAPAVSGFGARLPRFSAGGLGAIGGGGVGRAPPAAGAGTAPPGCGGVPFADSWRDSSPGAANAPRVQVALEAIASAAPTRRTETAPGIESFTRISKQTAKRPEELGLRVRQPPRPQGLILPYLSAQKSRKSLANTTGLSHENRAG